MWIGWTNPPNTLNTIGIAGKPRRYGPRRENVSCRGACMEVNMVRRLAVSVILIPIAAAAWLGVAQAQQPANPKVDSAVAAVAGGLVERGACTGIAVGTNDRGAQGFYAYGEVARGSGRRPAATTEFEIGSITKVFTTTLLALYAQRQVIKLDAPLQSYVPKGITVPSFAGRQITLVDLATHTSGLPRQPPMRGDSYSPSEMFAFLSSYRLRRTPGTQFQYSNLGVALLAHALAQATGTPWEQLVRQEITTKLGMPDTRLKLDEEERARLAIGYNRAGQPARENMPTWPAFNGAGGLFSTVSDMQRILAWNMGETKGDLPDSLLDDLHKSRFALPRAGAGVGLAWQIVPLGGGLSVVWKNGGTLGYSSYIGFVPQTRSGIVVLSNTKGCPATRAGYQILAALNGKAGEPNVPQEDEGN
jgi:serine-type D-Ala-D-Ala carboxypeptidase/endopeptidase